MSEANIHHCNNCLELSEKIRALESKQTSIRFKQGIIGEPLIKEALAYAVVWGKGNASSKLTGKDVTDIYEYMEKYIIEVEVRG